MELMRSYKKVVLLLEAIMNFVEKHQNEKNDELGESDFRGNEKHYVEREQRLNHTSKKEKSAKQTIEELRKFEWWTL